MKTYIILSLVGAFLSVLPAHGSAKTDLFEEELTALKEAHSDFNLNPCAETFHATYVCATPLLTSMQQQIEEDLKTLTLQYGHPLWSMACAQIKVLFPAQPQTFDESQILSRYTLETSTEEQNQDNAQKEISSQICQARAPCAFFMEDAIRSKNKSDKFLEEKTKQFLPKTESHHDEQEIILNQTTHDLTVPPKIDLQADSYIRPCQQTLAKEWSTFIRYNTCLEEVSGFYWTTEKKLVHAILKDRANSATDESSLFQPLCEAWIDSEYSQNICNLYRCISAQRSALQLYAILITEQDLCM